MAWNQEIKVFTVSDFDLRGPVKSCEVFTNYGKEIYGFNQEGWLVTSVTHYNESDYRRVAYRFLNGELMEKRSENFRNNVLDKVTSIANIYEVDTTGNKKIVENILSYQKEFLDRNEYFYGADGNLDKIIHTNNEGIDETLIKTSHYGDETTQLYTVNGTDSKSIRTSFKTSKKDGKLYVVLTKYFLEGLPQRAEEKVFDAEDRIVKQVDYEYDIPSGEFTPHNEMVYVYDGDGVLKETIAEQGDERYTKEFIYQFDDSEWKNWVKEIVTPENSYRTRKIEYYLTEDKD
ncbi:MAG: hypothetical protein AB3N16_13475 [Flavobacteriaceae bacterium]